MGREHPVRTVVVLLLMLGGLLLALARPAPLADADVVAGPTQWLARRADLLLQLALLFVGSLGIHALLPGRQDQDQENPR